MLNPDNHHRYRKNTPSDNRKRAILRSAYECREANEETLIEQITYLAKRNEELQHELQKNIQ